MTAQLPLGGVVPPALELVVSISHEGWGQIGVFLDRPQRAVQVMAVDAKGRPTGRGLRLRGGEIAALTVAITMARNRLENAT